MTPFRQDSQRSGATIGDMLVFLSILTLGFALLYPRMQERAFDQLLQEAVSAVDTLRAAASVFLDQNREWPAPSPAGDTPTELISALPAEYGLAMEGYALEWNRWEIVDRPEVASQGASPRDTVPTRVTTLFRTRGGVTVYSGNSALLAGLLEHYGTRLSFVRDTTWTLVVPR